MTTLKAVFCPSCDLTFYCDSADKARVTKESHEYEHKRTCLVYDVDAANVDFAEGLVI